MYVPLHTYYLYFIGENLVKPDKLNTMADEKRYKWLEPSEADGFRKRTQILLVTSNKHEYNAVLKFLQPVDGDALCSYFHICKIGFLDKSVIYTFGKFGAFIAAVHRMEKEGTAAAQDTLVVAAGCFGCDLHAIFAVGVTCGVKGKNNLLDVLVSKKITCYNAARKRDDVSTFPTSQFFLRYFNSLPSCWSSKNSRIAEELTNKPTMQTGLFLSGDYLNDNTQRKEELMNDFTKEVIGIEMDAAGLFHEYESHSCEIMIVKAVCHFGDGDKKLIDDYQPTAALLAAECLQYHLDNHTIPGTLRQTKQSKVYGKYINNTNTTSFR